MAIVMVDENTNDVLEMLAVEDQDPNPDAPREWSAQTFPRHRLAWGARNGVRTIANQEAERFLALRLRPRQLPGLLRHLRPAWMGCAPGEMHTTTAQLDKEEHVEPWQPDRFHGEEIDGEQPLPMRS